MQHKLTQNEPRSKRPSKKLLAKLYLDEKQSMVALALRFNTCIATIHNWCKFYGIKARPAHPDHIWNKGLTKHTSEKVAAIALKRVSVMKEKVRTDSQYRSKIFAALQKSWELARKHKKPTPSCIDCGKLLNRHALTTGAKRCTGCEAAFRREKLGKPNLKKLFTKEFLTELYVNQKLSSGAIAKRFDCSVSAVTKYLRLLSVPRRKSRAHIAECVCFICKLHRGEVHPASYIDGRSLVTANCQDCGKKLKSWRASRCVPCSKQGHEVSLATRQKLSISVAKVSHFQPGPTHPNWKGGISDLINKIRTCQKYGAWRLQVFFRDAKRCIQCGSKKDIEADHIVLFVVILQKFLAQYSQFNPVEDKERLLQLAEAHAPFWDVSNGQTLCHSCHYRKTYANSHDQTVLPHAPHPRRPATLVALST